MNILQRILLILFSVLVLLYSDSYDSSSMTLKLFLAATLLFFGLSPSSWFFRTNSIKQDISPTQDSIQETEEIVFDDDELISLPVIGFPSSDKVMFLKSLIKLRSAEIANIYLQLRQYQKEAKDGNWVPLFMKKMAVSDLHGPYIHVEEEEEEKAKTEAIATFEERYKFCSIAPTELYEDQIADLHVALLYWRYPPQTIIHRLKELQAFGFLGDWIDVLIKEYQALDQCGGDFKSIFRKDKNTAGFKCSLEKISSLWSEIARILKTSIFLQQIKNETSNEQNADENTGLHEIEALIELERYLDCAITQENLDQKGFISLPSKEKEKFFLSRLKFNPFWYHYS